MAKRHKVSLNTTVSPLAKKQVKEMTEAGVFASESNVVETSVYLMHFVLNSDIVLAKAAAMGIKPLPVGGAA
jgi:hypothetical protein